MTTGRSLVLTSDFRKDGMVNIGLISLKTCPPASPLYVYFHISTPYFQNISSSHTGITELYNTAPYCKGGHENLPLFFDQEHLDFNNRGELCKWSLSCWR